MKDLRNINKKPKATALVHHTHQTNHQFDFEAKEVVQKVRSQRTIRIQETNQILMHQHEAVNFKSDGEHVTPEFYNLILKHKKRRIVNRKHQHMNAAQLFGGNT